MVVPVARAFLNNFTETYESASTDDGVVDANGVRWENELSPEEQRAIKRARRAQLGMDVFACRSDLPFILPPIYTFVFRAFTSLDGIGKGLDKGYVRRSRALRTLNFFKVKFYRIHFHPHV